MIAPTVAHLSFVRDDGQPLDFVPGQFIQIHFQYADGTATKRSYSIANGDAQTYEGAARVDIAVSYVPGGAATALFEALPIGERVDASGPFGRFILMPADANRRYLLIGTGTGITPYRAMLPQLQQRMAERDLQVAMLQGARAPHELLYGDEFRAVADAHPGFRYLPCLSREQPDATSPHAHPDVQRGYVQNALEVVAPDPEHDIAYLCGNPDMVDACFEALKARGFAVPQIRREKYVSSK